MRRLYKKPTVKTIHLESLEMLAGSMDSRVRKVAGDATEFTFTGPTIDDNYGDGSNFK